MNWEWLLFLVVAVGATVPFFHKRRGPWGLAVLGVATVCSATVWYNAQQSRQSRDATFAQSLPREGRPGGYISSDSCRSCHPRQYETWHRSFHRTMTQYATPETVRGDFENVSLELNGQIFQLEKRGDEFWVNMIDPDLGLIPPSRVAAMQPKRVSRRLGLVTGSHHMQVYWVPSAEGNLQLILPFTYLFAEHRWVGRNDVFLMDPQRPPPVQLWNANCIQCHSTAGQPRPDPSHWTHNDTRTAEIGIACEACHGPAEEHVRQQQNPLTRYAQHLSTSPTKLAIVDPAKLDHRASSQVCGQCHGIKSIAPGHPWRFEGFEYRPGQDLDKGIPVVRAIAHAKEPWYNSHVKRDPTFIVDRYWSDGMVRVSGREYNGLLETPCYQKGQMSCLSCHALHESAPVNQLANDMETNQACVQCHDKLQLRAHTHHAEGSNGSLCYNCHMPRTTYGLMKAIRSHTIDSPNVTTTLKTGRPNACNLCHLDKSLGWTAQKLSNWFGQPTPRLSEDEKRVPATALWALRGDAGQRAIAAWHMGWEPAREISGERWLTPYLAQLLEDPYSSVRYIAGKSLKRASDFADLQYDFIGSTAHRAQAHADVLSRWKNNEAAPSKMETEIDRAAPVKLGPASASDSSIGRKPESNGDRVASTPFLRPETSIDPETWARLLENRDDRSINLQE